MAAKKREDEEAVPKHVGTLMRKWREAAGMSLATVGEAIGVGKGHLSDVENGNKNLSLPRFLAFCQAIKTPASKVLEERLLARHRDVDRLAADIVEHKGGAKDLAWLADLSTHEYKAAIQAARDRVDLERMRSHEREDGARSKVK